MRLERKAMVALLNDVVLNDPCANLEVIIPHPLKLVFHFIIAIFCKRKE
jgi:hypothetical protein